MKTLHIPFLASLLILALTLSCSKDDPKASGTLVGNWKFTSESLINCTDPNNNGTETCSTNCGVLVITETNWSFTDPANPSNSGTGTYTTSGSSITISVTAGTGYSGTYTYSISGSTLTLSDPDYGMGCTGNLNFTRI